MHTHQRIHKRIYTYVCITYTGRTHRSRLYANTRSGLRPARSAVLSGRLSGHVDIARGYGRRCRVRARRRGIISRTVMRPHLRKIASRTTTRRGRARVIIHLIITTRNVTPTGNRVPIPSRGPVRGSIARPPLTDLRALDIVDTRHRRDVGSSLRYSSPDRYPAACTRISRGYFPDASVWLELHLFRRLSITPSLSRPSLSYNAPRDVYREMHTSDAFFARYRCKSLVFLVYFSDGTRYTYIYISSRARFALL